MAKKKHKKNYRKKYQKVESDSQNKLALKMSKLKEGGLEYLLSEYPNGWGECNLKNLCDEEVMLPNIEHPIKGNHFYVELVPGHDRAKMAFAELLAELRCKFSLRLLYFIFAEIYVVATDAAEETVYTLLEHSLNKYDIGISRRIDY